VLLGGDSSSPDAPHAKPLASISRHFFLDQLRNNLIVLQKGKDAHFSNDQHSIRISITGVFHDLEHLVVKLITCRFAMDGWNHSQHPAFRF
jgi:hypothetical protein